MKKQVLSTLFALNMGLLLPTGAETVLAVETPIPSSLEQVSLNETLQTTSVATGPSFVATGSSIQVVTPTQSSSSKNINAQNYAQYGSTVKSYLYENGDGGVTRVEFLGNKVVVENYNSDFEIEYSGQLDMELPLWGGFYSGEDYNFIVFAQNNPEEDNNVEVLRVVKYTKDWQRIESASIFGANTKEPLYVGSLRMVQNEDILYIHTSHKMYLTYDGRNHQANFVIAVKVSDMTVAGQASGIGNGGGYASHSFNQFIVSDGSVILTANHGDAYPRAIAITQYTQKNNGLFAIGHYSGKATSVLAIKGGRGNVQTGASIGGIAITNQSYLTTGNSVPQDDTYNPGATRNIYVTSTTKDGSSTQIYWLTNYSASEKVSVSTPHLVKIDDEHILILYTVDGTINYTYVDGEGKQISQIYTMEGSLSDCVPILYDNKVVWYYTNDDTPVFCSIDPANMKPSRPSTDSSSDDSDDSDDSRTSSVTLAPSSYEGKGTLTSSEQAKVENAVNMVLGNNTTIASVQKTENGICIIAKSGDVIYSKTDGNLAINEWEKVGTDWYYFDADKKAAKGWKYLGDKWYYLDDTSAKMVTGWKKTATENWFYFDTQNGDMKTDWQFINNNWYYLDTVNGDMKTNWQFINGSWYYLDTVNGDMKTDWQFINGSWYYLDSKNGNMKTGWQFINNNWYYLDAVNGNCLINTITPDGYATDENGAWIP